MTRVLFVCMGNICRSPAAEGVFRKMVEEAGLAGLVRIQSAGTSGYHEGELPDERMREHAKARGYRLESRARGFNAKKDFEEFDLILTMDHHNFANIKNLDSEDRHSHKIKMFVSYCTVHNVDHVPDPYYGGDEGFELVLDIVEDGCQGLVREIKNGGKK